MEIATKNNFNRNCHQRKFQWKIATRENFNRKLPPQKNFNGIKKFGKQHQDGGATKPQYMADLCLKKGILCDFAPPR